MKGFLTLVAACVAVASPAWADGRVFEVKKGEVVDAGHWYEGDFSTCKQIGTASLRVVKAPTLGSLSVVKRKAPPVVDTQRLACPTLTLDQVILSYEARATGDDSFEFKVDYTTPINGDWSYIDTVHVR